MTDPLTRLSTALAGRYRIERELGRGGMATVYLAHDLKHDRDVALKVLRPELAAVLGAQRFLQEITVTANLQHPHVLALYDSGEADGFLFYVMPYVEGEPLDVRLKREKQLGIEEAVRIATEVASALDYAHRHAVVHRDIKPANVLLQDGQALVADFGIALALKAAGGDRLTETGLSLGTPHYMSPEQAMGDRDVDARTDIYSLGAVLYEMLSGEPPHTGSTIQAVLSRVLTEEPRPLGQLRHSVPAHVAMAVEQALAKVPADRFASAADFATALKDPRFARTYVRTAARTAAPARWRRPRLWAATVVVIAAFAGGTMLGGMRTSGQRHGDLVRFSVSAEPTALLINLFGPQLAVSRDGALIAFVGRAPRGSQLFVRALADSMPRPVTGTEGGLAPFLSADRRWLGFWAAGRLWKVPVEGGVATEIADEADYYAGWTDDGTLVYTAAQRQTLHLMAPDGRRRVVARTDTARFLGLSLLPGTRHALTALQVGGGNRTTVVAVSLQDGTIEPVNLADALTAKWVPSGHLVYQRRLGGPLYAAPFDLKARRVTALGRQIAPATSVTFRIFPHWDVAHNGTIVYFRPEPFQLVLTNRAGAVTVLQDEPRNYHHPRFSPDGRAVALDITEGDERDVWILHLADRTLTRLTVREVANDPLWSPDGRRLAYTSVRGAMRGVFVRNADGSGTPDSILLDAHDRSSGSWSPDGRTIVSSTLGLAGLHSIPLDEPAKAAPIPGSRPTEAFPALSPDGHWLAYVSDESGRREVYVRPFPGPGGRRQVSVNGGMEPVWTRDGRELLYRDTGGGRDTLVAAQVRTTPTFEVLRRTPLFDVTDYGAAEDHANFDVDPSGNTFVMVRNPRPLEIHVILNWPVLLEEGARP